MRAHYSAGYNQGEPFRYWYEAGQLSDVGDRVRSRISPHQVADMYGNRPSGEGPRSGTQIEVIVVNADFTDVRMCLPDTSTRNYDFVFTPRNNNIEPRIDFNEDKQPVMGQFIGVVWPG